MLISLDDCKIKSIARSITEAKSPEITQLQSGSLHRLTLRPDERPKQLQQSWTFYTLVGGVAAFDKLGPINVMIIRTSF